MTLLTSIAFAEDRELAAGSNATSPEESRPWSVGARAFGPFLGEAILGGGIDVTGSVVPHFAVGVQYIGFVADQGADPHYCASCVYSGASAFAYGEGRYWPDLWLTPYARLGAGLSYLKGQDAEMKAHQESKFGVLTEVGLEFHPGWLSLRAFAFQHFAVASDLDDKPLRGVGLQLGGRL